MRLIWAEKKRTELCLQIELAEEKSQSVHSGKSPLLAQQMYVTKEKSRYSECHKNVLHIGPKSARNCDKLKSERGASPENPGPTFNSALLPLTLYRVIILASFCSARQQSPFQHLQRKLQNIGTKERNHRIAPVSLDTKIPTLLICQMKQLHEQHVAPMWLVMWYQTGCFFGPLTISNV